MLRFAAALALLGLQGTKDDDTTTYGYVIVRHAGWTAEAKNEGLFLHPGDLGADQNYVVIVMAGERGDGTLVEGLDKVWKQAAGSGKVVRKAPGKELKTEGGTDGLLSVGLLETPTGAQLIVAAAVFKPGDRFQAVLAMTTQDATFQEYTEGLRTLLKGLRFRNVELPSYEILLLDGASPEIYVLFKDGSSLATLPKEGMDGWDLAAAREKFEGKWGTHESKEGKLTLKTGAKSLQFTPQQDGTMLARDLFWHRVQSSTGLRFAGRYLIAGQEDRPETAFLRFKADGTFEDGDLVRRVDPEVKPGQGVYEIMDNTLYLVYSDGRKARLSFMTVPAPMKENALEIIYVGGTRLRRAK